MQQQPRLVQFEDQGLKQSMVFLKQPVRVVFDQESGMRKFPKKGGASRRHARSPRHHLPFTK